MYNEAFKLQYIEANRSRDLNIEQNVGMLFRRSAEYEELFGKDLYDFTSQEIIGYYKALCTPSLESLMIMNNQYKLYTAYAVGQGLVRDNQNHFDEFDNVQLMNCVNIALAQAKVLTREELLHVLNSSDVENPSDKFLCLALFEGVCGRQCSELSQLYPEDIYAENRMLCLFGGRKLEVSQQLIDWAIEAAGEYEYYNSSGNLRNAQYDQSDRRVLKWFSNSFAPHDDLLRGHRNINNRLDRIKARTGCQAIGISSLKESGRLELIRKIMAEGFTAREVINCPEVESRYGTVSSIPRYCLKYGLTES